MRNMYKIISYMFLRIEKELAKVFWFGYRDCDAFVFVLFWLLMRVLYLFGER
jgi:hypothetical protein